MPELSYVQLDGRKDTGQKAEDPDATKKRIISNYSPSVEKNETSFSNKKQHLHSASMKRLTHHRSPSDSIAERGSLHNIDKKQSSVAHQSYLNKLTNKHEQPSPPDSMNIRPSCFGLCKQSNTEYSKHSNKYHILWAQRRLPL